MIDTTRHDHERGVTAQPTRPTTLQVAVWLAIMATAIVITVVNWSGYQIGAHFDDARYIILARSLLDGGHYGMVHTPGEPGVGKYPFGFPMFLLPGLLLTPDSWEALKITPFLATLGIATVLFWGWRWLSKTTSYGWALAITALTTLSPMSASHMRRIMSEPLFTLFCLLSIVLAEQFARGRRHWWWSTALAVSLTLTLYTRTIGCVLVVCVLAYLFYVCGRSFWRPALLVGLQAGLLLAAVVAFTPVQARDLVPLEYLNDENARFFAPAAAPAPSGSTSDTSAVTPDAPPTSALERSLSRARVILLFGIRQHLGNDVRSVALPFGGGDAEARLGARFGVPALPQITSYLMSALLLLGFVLWFRRERLSLLPAFAAVYFLSLFLWVWNEPRLLYPIQAQIYFAVLLAISWVLKGVLKAGFNAVARVLRSWRRQLSPATLPTAALSTANALIMTCIVGALVLGMLTKSSLNEESLLHTGDLAQRTAWLRANTTPADVVATNAPEIDYLYGGRKTVPYPNRPPSSQMLAEYLGAFQVHYVLLAPRVAWQAEYAPAYDNAALQLKALLDDLSAAGAVTPVFTDEAGQIRIYQVNSSAALAPSPVVTTVLTGAQP